MVSVGKDDEAAKKAEAVRARLTAGEDFRQGGRRSLGQRVQGEWRPDWPDRDAHELSPDAAEDAPEA